MKSLLRLFRSEPSIARPLYDQVVGKARTPHWYVEGRVPDTMEGRFAVLATLLALTDLRLERGGEDAGRASVGLAECFVHDMDSQLRQDGVGDPVMGKKVGSLVGALGGRVGAWRRAVDGEESWEAVASRSLYREKVPSDAALAHSLGELKRYWEALQGRSDEALIGGVLP
ncbi:ubiquinol-cytochrome C chaperone family protein [Sphingomonas sp. LHG3406-1]|uniref:ubiquinol-cytochrome C chaperone family protein n=1 Tax=Sphingomonas sp. LHG3406-1 TaxID=2804617 RepID=UPI0026073183|nr:ubiquinol-cytochrome C chaperone family protein [Sphingomonas sp. LHG3406-1]